jgi:hypothetical protein
MFVPHRKHTYGPLRLVMGIPSLHVDVRTSQETHLWASTACYGDTVTSLYGDDFPTSQGTHLWASTACGDYIFTFLYVDGVHTSQETPMGLQGLLRR